MTIPKRIKWLIAGCLTSALPALMCAYSVPVELKGCFKKNTARVKIEKIKPLKFVVLTGKIKPKRTQNFLSKIGPVVSMLIASYQEYRMAFNEADLVKCCYHLPQKRGPPASH